MTRPKLSILIPSHRAALLHDAMGSVFNQTRKDIQLLVSYAESPHVPYWRTKINELAEAAIGEYVAVLCDDDVLHPQFAEKTLAKAAEGYDVVYTHYGRWQKEQVMLWPSDPWELASFQNGGCNPLCGATFVVRRELWREVGGVDPEQIFWDWALAYACYKAQGTAAQIPEPLVVLRVHGDHDQMDDREAMRLLHTKYPELKAAA